jgi:hypothetical protein
VGLLFVACALSPNAVSDWFAGKGTEAGFAVRGGLAGALLLCTAVILAFLRVEDPEKEETKAEVEAPKPGSGDAGEKAEAGE